MARPRFVGVGTIVTQEMIDYCNTLVQRQWSKLNSEGRDLPDTTIMFAEIIEKVEGKSPGPVNKSDPPSYVLEPGMRIPEADDRYALLYLHPKLVYVNFIHFMHIICDVPRHHCKKCGTRIVLRAEAVPDTYADLVYLRLALDYFAHLRSGECVIFALHNRLGEFLPHLYRRARDIPLVSVGRAVEVVSGPQPVYLCCVGNPIAINPTQQEPLDMRQVVAREKSRSRSVILNSFVQFVIN